MDGKHKLDLVKRHQLRERIVKLGVSYQQVAHFLGMGKSTLQRWINGRTGNCSPALWTRLNTFLCGKLDGELALSAMEDASSKYVNRRVSPTRELDDFMTRLFQSYRVCEQHRCQALFLERVGECLGVLAGKLLQEKA